MEIGFFLKKTVSYFVEPFGMILTLLLIGIYFLYKNKYVASKFFLTFAFVMTLLYSSPYFSNFLITQLENKYPKYDYKSNVKYIHVLGSGHNTDPEQPLSSQVGGASIKRNIEGILVHFNTKDTKIIFTGYAGKTDMSTAQMNASFALALGVKKENIIVNPKPRDTQEEALFTKTIVEDESFILVTSATHMPRSMMLFKSFGLNPIAAPTNYYKEKVDGYFQAPDLGALQKSQIAMHEYLGILWSKLKASI